MGTWRPTIVLYVKGKLRTSENQFQMQLMVTLCDEHKEFDTAAFLSMNAERLRAAFVDLGIGEPDMGSCEVLFHPVVFRGQG